MKAKRFDEKCYLAFDPSMYQSRWDDHTIYDAVSSLHGNRLNNGTPPTTQHKESKIVISLQDFCKNEKNIYKIVIISNKYLSARMKLIGSNPTE